jgi:hypothetical protein
MILHDLKTLPPALKAGLQGRKKRTTVQLLKKGWKLKSPLATGFLLEGEMKEKKIRLR